MPLFLQVGYLQSTTAFNNPLILTKISEYCTSPTQYLFISMSPSTNTLCGSIEKITIYTETIKIPTFPLPYVTQTDSPITISKIIKDLATNFIAHIKETNKEPIVYRDENFDAKFEKHIQTFSLQVKEDSDKFSSKLIEYEVLTLASEHQPSKDNLERKFQSKLSYSDKGFEKQ